MNIYILDDKIDHAEAHMLYDLYLLDISNQKNILFLRHFIFETETITYGRFQKKQIVIDLYSNKNTICQRPTGGGIVEHINSWSYSLIIPSSHFFYSKKLKLIYKLIHETIILTFDFFNEKTQLNETLYSIENKLNNLICFQQPSLNDVIYKKNLKKIAGLASKKTKNGILIQGTIDQSMFVIDWNYFKYKFNKNISNLLEAKINNDSFKNLNIII